MHGIAGLSVGPHLLWVLPLLALLFLFALGGALLVAAVQVYFRDLTSFLTYALRIWLFASPILYYAEDVPERYKPILWINPLYPVLTSLSDVTNAGHNPSAALLAAATAWSLAALVVGSLFFVSREREFAIRL
jgi:ABC-type polysaccharide/polyol phosphate export permease